MSSHGVDVKSMFYVSNSLTVGLESLYESKIREKNLTDRPSEMN